MRNKVISILFILCIFAVGAATAVKAAPYVSEDIGTQKYSELSSGLDATLTNRFALRRHWVNINGLFLRAVDKTYVENEEADVFRLKNGMLLYDSDKLPDEDIKWYAEQVSAFDRKLGDVPLLYVSLPYKIKNGDSMMPAGVTDHANSNANQLTAELRTAGVDTLDMRTVLDEACSGSSEEYYRMFYRTDQHWTNRTALLAVGAIAERLRADGIEYNKNTFDISAFDSKVYEDWFLGSFGKKAGAWYAGTDDYELLTPAYETEFTFHADSENGPIDRSGTFAEALLDRSNLEKDLFRKNTYETYTGGNYAITRVINKRNSKGGKVLLVRDSFSCSMMPFLALACHRIDAVDPRSFDECSILEFARKGRYDAVVIAYNPSVYGWDAFNFFE